MVERLRCVSGFVNQFFLRSSLVKDVLQAEAGLLRPGVKWISTKRIRFSCWRI